MTNKENLAQLLIETSELLNDEYEPLNEGIVRILGLSFIGFITLSALIANIQYKLDYNKKKKSLKNIQEYKYYLGKLANELDKVKFISYKPEAIQVLKDSLSLLKESDKKLKDIDDKLRKCKSIDEFKKIKNKLIKEYNELEHDIKIKISKIIKPLKESKSEFINDRDIIKPLKEYLSYITKDYYYRNLDGDDFWEGIFFLEEILNNYGNDDYDEDKVDILYNEVYDCITTYPDYHTHDLSEFKEVFKYIKVQFKGKEIKN